MAHIAYDAGAAAAFEAGRHIAEEGLGAWRAATTRHLDPVPGTRLLDLGAGTGMWSRAFTSWYDGVEVVAVEPSAATRARCAHPHALFRFFPEAIRVLDSYPSLADVQGAFAAGGFATVAVEQVPQVTAASLRDVAAGLRREAHTPLRLIADDEYAAGLARLREAAGTESGPAVDTLDLLVLR